MEQNVYFIKVLSGKGKTKNLYRIQTLWDNSGFAITILDGSKAFQTTISKTILNNKAKNYEIDLEEYTNTLRLCLSQSNLEDFAYNIKNNIFLISRIEQKFNRQIADFNLEIVDFHVASANFIDELMKCNEELQIQISINKEEKDVAINEKNNYLEKLQQYVENKEKMENDLYCKFILLLNEKKLRIQYLTELLTNQKQNINNDTMEEELQPKINNLRNKEMLSESSDSEDEKQSEQIVHQVQIEVTPQETDFLDYDTQEISLQTLPKRSKVCENKVNEEIKNSTKKSSQLHLEDITNESEMQDMPEFNTQDLFDRL